MYQFQKLCFINPPDQILETTTTITTASTFDEAVTNTLPVHLSDDFSTSPAEFPVPVATKDLSNSIEGKVF